MEKTFNPCDECEYSYSKQNQKSGMCKICEFKQLLELEEQGLLLRLPVTVEAVIDKLFSHNELIALWTLEKGYVNYHEEIWRGMAWDIPEEYKNFEFVKIFGAIPESIGQADTINIEVVLNKEVEATLEKIKGEEHE